PLDDHDRRDNRHLERGYRDRDTRERDRDRDRYENEDKDQDRRREERLRSRDDSRNGGDARKRDSDTRQNGERRRDPFGGEPTDSPATGEAPKKEKKKEKKKREPKIAPTAEPMIIVNVNDRLGTKAAIPCLASDSIRGFKAMVAARIGREPHEIMLKRQGERPFKDVLTLEDYGVSNGVQLDLEVDTGD
ncbi:MAG: hypothetical protein Q9210_007659, partial [Variospora velana]